MTTYVSKDVQQGLAAARLASIKKASRLRVLVGETFYPVLRLTRTGFSVELGVVPPLRGLVDIYDGSVHLYQCLIVASDAEHGEMQYEFKRSTQAHDSPPLDFYRDPDQPRGYLPRD